MFRIIKTEFDTYVLAGPDGALARTTDGIIFIPLTRSVAQEACDFLNQASPKKRQGSHKMKSLFGTEG